MAWFPFESESERARISYKCLTEMLENNFFLLSILSAGKFYMINDKKISSVMLLLLGFLCPI